MRYEAKLSVAEIDALATLIGVRLDGVTSDGWSAELRFGAKILQVIPEEVPTPDADHPYGDVDRPMLRLGDDLAPLESSAALSDNLGTVRAVNVISIMHGFTPMIDCPAAEILPDIVVPRSQGYGRMYFAPEQRERALLEVGAGALVELDAAIELVCDGCESLIVHTPGYFVQVSLQGLPVGEEWVACGRYLRHPV